MRTQAVNIIAVTWEGPYTYAEAVRKDSHPTDIGLYQIYGTHGVFGPASILYVGMTLSTFADRLKQHREWIEWESNPVSIYLGKLEDATRLSPDERKNQIAVAERLLVYFTAPPYNSALLTGGAWCKLAEAPPTVVINLRYRNRLPAEVSNLAEIEPPAVAARPSGDDEPG